jgi:hypothetical protein
MRLEDIEPDRVASAVSKAVVEAVAAGGDVEAVIARAISDARRSLDLGSNPSSPSQTTATPAPATIGPMAGEAREVVTEADVLDAVRAGRTELSVGNGALVTPLARDTAKDRGVRLVEA